MTDIRYAGLGYPMATQNPDGTWSVPTYDSASTGTWGSFRIEIGATWDTTGTAYAAAGSVAVKTAAGTDITTVNGVPTVIESLSYGEPYGELTGSIRIPRATPFDSPAWLTGGANLDIWRVLPAAEAASAGTAEVPYFHGIVASIEIADGAGIENAVSLQLVGALYGEASVRAHQPLLLDTSNDVGTWAGRALSPELYSRPIPYFSRFSFDSATTSIDTRYRGSRGQMVIDYLDELMVLAQSSTAQWTVSRAYQTLGGKSYPRARHYYLRAKSANMGTAVQQNTVFMGGYGVTVSLTQDTTEQFNAIYGEGVNPVDSSDLSGSRWRNAKYPMLAGTVPTYPNRVSGSTYPITVGDDDGDFDNGYAVVSALNAQLRAGGWPYATLGTAFTAATGSAITALKQDVGYANSNANVGGTAEWALIFGDNSSATGDLASGYFQPLAAGSAVEPYLYSSFGEVIGVNPSFDAGLLRVDRTISYGDNVSKATARTNARRLITNSIGAWTGTISLTSDPTDEGGVGRSHLDIREGGWIQLNNFPGGTATQFYIAGVTHGDEGLSTTLTVSTVPYDLLDLSTRLERNRTARENPAKSFYSQRTQSMRPFRSVTGWDAESGAGVIKSTATAGSAWTVGRFLGAQYGSIGSLRIDHAPAAGYCFAVFGGSVSSTFLSNLIASPLGTVTGEYPSWWQHPDKLTALGTAGFIEAWGSNGEAAGYYPGAQSIGGTVAGTATGRLEDAGSWTFASLEPPWLYYAIWPTTAGTVAGQMRIVVDEG